MKLVRKTNESLSWLLRFKTLKEVAKPQTPQWILEELEYSVLVFPKTTVHSLERWQVLNQAAKTKTRLSHISLVIILHSLTNLHVNNLLTLRDTLTKPYQLTWWCTVKCQCMNILTFRSARKWLRALARLNVSSVDWLSTLRAFSVIWSKNIQQMTLITKGTHSTSTLWEQLERPCPWEAIFSESSKVFVTRDSWACQNQKLHQIDQRWKLLIKIPLKIQLLGLNSTQCLQLAVV
jgi:hypothetical protein